MAAGFKTATVASGDVPSTQTDFPSYVDLSRLGITTLAEAQSVRVYADSAKTTEWAREIVSATEMHVKVPSLTSTVSMYVDWDGTSADYAVTDTYGRNAVWSDYRASYRLEGTTDSAGNFNLTNNGSVSFNSQKIGKGADFGTVTGSVDRLYTYSNVFPSNNSVITVSFWAKQNNLLSAANVENGYLTAGYTAASGDAMTINSYWNSGSPTWNIVRRASSDAVYTASNANDTSWHHVVYTYDTSDNKYRIYLDGSLIITSSANTGSYNTSSYKELNLGGGYMSNNGDIAMDEVRVSANVSSADWISTEYNNQSDEAGFWGTWSDVGGGGATFVPKSNWFM